MKNYDHVVTIDKDKHARLRVKTSPEFAHAKELNLASISLTELTACAANFPIVFVNPEGERIRPVVMFGLRPGENVYYAKEGWDCTYIPLMVQRHPFMIGFDDRNEDSKMLVTCLDKNSPLLSNTDEGIALFNEAGEPTEFLNTRKRQLAAIFEGEKTAEQFTQKMRDLNLLAPFELIVQSPTEGARRVSGLFTLNESRLRALSPEQLQDLHKLDFLPACYIILGSLAQIHNMMKLRNRKSAEQVDYYIDLQPQPIVGAGVPVA